MFEPLIERALMFLFDPVVEEFIKGLMILYVVGIR